MKKSYRPLITLIFIAAAASYAMAHDDLALWMHAFMGFFLCQFAMLKLFDPSLFAEGFQKYDLIAKRVKLYAQLYPFIELALGLSYLSHYAPILTYLVTVIVMVLSAVGVIVALIRGLDLRCACMGTVLNVPLSTVTLWEDLIMGAMAAFMLLKETFL
jgi:hypothetical protein